MSEQITRRVGVRYAADGFDPKTGDPQGVQEGSFFAKCDPNETHEDAVFQVVAAQFQNGPFPANAQVLSFKVNRKDDRANRYEFSDSKSYSVTALQKRPAIVRGNLVDSNLGTNAGNVTD